MNAWLSNLSIVIALIYTVVFHELGHGVVALLNGDNTARRNGRLSLNPLAHLDPIGLLSLIVFKFGWAKPVPINPYRFKHPKLGMVTTALAGVSVNFVSALLCILALTHIRMESLFLRTLLSDIALYGIGFFVFNLLPIPPLDGSRVITTFLPLSTQYEIAKYERYSFPVFILLIYTGLLSDLISPMIRAIIDFLLRL